MRHKSQSGEFIFLPYKDDLALVINDKANQLFLLLNNFDTEKLVLESLYKDYFIKHHLSQRLFFSIESSADIIYHSVKRTGKPIAELNFADYGAGLGTLYILAKKVGFKKVIYNDYLPEWANAAESICRSLGIYIDAYTTGDIDNLLLYADNTNFKYDIIASRNVIEHIYNIPLFYKLIYQHNNKAIIYSTTSANFHNPVALLKHILYHKKMEKNHLFPQRETMILEMYPSITKDKLTELAAITRGRAKEDFTNTVHCFMKNEPILPVPFLRTNSCDAATGYWVEYIMPKKDHTTIANAAGFKLEFSSGFWDTHYKFAVANILAKFLNILIRLSGRKAYPLSPFVNIVAYN